MGDNLLHHIFLPILEWSVQNGTKQLETDELWQQTFLYWTSVQFTDVVTALVNNNGYR
mgnify:CR=1 FL=1